MANLKFYKTALAPVGTTEKPLEQGAVWFDSTNGLIHVFNGSTWDAYVGVRDAVVEGEKLTITKRNGTTVSVDFSVYATDEALELLTGRVSTLEGTVATHGGNITDLQGRMTTVEGKATAAEGKLAGLTGTVVEDIAAAVLVEENRAKGVENGLDTRLGTLETKVNTDHEGRIVELENLLTGSEGGSVSDMISDAVEAAEDRVDEKLTTKVDKATYEAYEKANNERVGAVEDAVEAEVERATGKEGELAQAIATEKDRIDILVGKDENGAFVDAGKSVRTIATEEVAKIVNETDNDSVDTLKEIAAWIAAHPKDAAEYNARITANETAIGNLQTAVTDITKEGGDIAVAVAAAKTEITGNLEEADSKTLAAINDEIDALQGLVGSTSVDSQIKAITNPLAERVGANEAAVATVDSRIAAAKSGAEATAAADAASKANTAESNAKGYADGLIAAEVTRSNKYADDAVAVEAAKVSANTAAIAALDAKVTNGLAWAVYE